MYVHVPSVEVGVGIGDDPLCPRKINKTFLSDTVAIGWIHRKVSLALLVCYCYLHVCKSGSYLLSCYFWSHNSQP